jgi:type I restriction enzyme R subunit
MKARQAVVHHPRLQKATELFADPRFDGLPEKVLVVKPGDISDPDSDFGEQLEAEDKLITAPVKPGKMEPNTVNRDKNLGSGEFRKMTKTKSANSTSTAWT